MELNLKKLFEAINLGQMGEPNPTALVSPQRSSHKKTPFENLLQQPKPREINKTPIAEKKTAPRSQNEFANDSSPLPRKQKMRLEQRPAEPRETSKEEPYSKLTPPKTPKPQNPKTPMNIGIKC